MLNPLKVLVSDLKIAFKAMFYAFNSNASLKLSQKKEETLDRIKNGDETEHEIYLQQRHAYLKSLIRDHEPDEIYEQMRLADDMLKMKARVLRYQIDDPSLDDIVSIGRHKQEAIRNVEAKYSNGINQLTAEVENRLAWYVIVSLIMIGIAIVMI